MSSTTVRPHLVTIGGFLGAGKTTAVRRLGTYLTNLGLRVAIVTNDQGSDVVDTRVMRACGFATEEIAGGCFCCRFDELLGTASRLALHADVIVAEAVGSCTDLRATVVAPMRRLAGERLTVGPLSVVIDARRAMSELGLVVAPRFSTDVVYVYERQLEEADVLVINKCDLLQLTEQDALRHALAARAPRATIVSVSARDDVGLENWFPRLLDESVPPRPAMQVDYDVYASGEAKLGWLDATVTVTSSPARGGDLLLASLAGAVRGELAERGVEVAHLKMTLSAQANASALVGAISVVRGDALPELTLDVTEAVSKGTFTVNLRAEAGPERLREILAAAVMRTGGEAGTALVIERCDAFSPGRPTPTHRDADG